MRKKKQKKSRKINKIVLIVGLSLIGIFTFCLNYENIRLEMVNAKLMDLFIFPAEMNQYSVDMNNMTFEDLAKDFTIYKVFEEDKDAGKLGSNNPGSYSSSSPR